MANTTALKRRIRTRSKEQRAWSIESLAFCSLLPAHCSTCRFFDMASTTTLKRRIKLAKATLNRSIINSYE